MSKSKRLLELMMAVNRMRKFTVKELAAAFGVSPRTILRDLQELSELGVPLYSEVGPHGGYRVLSERLLPPIAFTEEEAVAVFFASHALRHYDSLPFAAETSAALHKFYLNMPGDIRDRIDAMKNRVDFVTPVRSRHAPHLTLLLEAAVSQKVLRISYEGRSEASVRDIQPIGIYAASGVWYCPAHCFLRGGIRVFRCDRIGTAGYDPASPDPLDLQAIDLASRHAAAADAPSGEACFVELTPEGVLRCESELWPSPSLHIREDGSGWLEGRVPERDLPFLAAFIIGLGQEATALRPASLVHAIRRQLAGLSAKYAE